MIATTQEQLEALIKDFDFAFCRSKRPLSVVIRLFTTGKWSHIAHFRRLEDGRIYVVDAQRNGYEPKELSEWLSKYKYSFEVVRNPTIDKNVMINRERIMLGIEYDFLGLVRHAYKNISELRNKLRADKLPTWIELSQRFEDKRLYCSEAELRMIGRNEQLDPNEAYPVFIWEGYAPVFEFRR